MMARIAARSGLIHISFMEKAVSLGRLVIIVSDIVKQRVIMKSDIAKAADNYCERKMILLKQRSKSTKEV
jgi:hypothetical protein